MDGTGKLVAGLGGHESHFALQESSVEDLSALAETVPFVQVEVLDPVEHVDLVACRFVIVEIFLDRLELGALVIPVSLNRVVIEDVALSRLQPHVVEFPHVLIVLRDQETSADDLLLTYQRFQR